MRIGTNYLLAFLLTFTPLSAALADAWQTNLKGGGVVRVDPQTHKPTIYYQGGSTQLWDGVHETDSGQVIIVRDGVAVPDENMINTWTHPVPRDRGGQDGRCDRLVRKVCGLDSQCLEREACVLARQLQRMEGEERKQLTYGQAAFSIRECEKGLRDPSIFPACDKVSGDRPSSCQRLKQKVCGEQGQCESSEPCHLAKQLLSMDMEERLDNPIAGEPRQSAIQCNEAVDNAYFRACEQ